MYGYLTADRGTLTPEELTRYRELYCGLCRSLKERHGDMSRLTLNYDMTFLVILLCSLYEPEEASGCDSCLRHPFEPKPWVRNEISDYAADMNIALAYLKLMDDWKDEHSAYSRFRAKLLRPSFDRVNELYPRQCGGIESAIEALGEIESSGEFDPDGAAACFGTIMEQVFLYRCDNWSRWLSKFAGSLGRVVYIMDAVMDLDSDVFSGSYNPFRPYYGKADNERHFRDILKMELGECLYYFDKLPLVRDVGLLKNILCQGLWYQFDKKYSRKDS